MFLYALKAYYLGFLLKLFRIVTCSFLKYPLQIAIGEFRIFIVVYKDMKCLENINNITKIYGYNSKSYKIKDQIWDEQYLGGVCKISQALYFNGKAKIGII